MSNVRNWKRQAKVDETFIELRQLFPFGTSDSTTTQLSAPINHPAPLYIPPHAAPSFLPSSLMDRFLAPHTSEAIAHSHLTYVIPPVPPAPPHLPTAKTGSPGTSTIPPSTKLLSRDVHHTRHSTAISLAQTCSSSLAPAANSRASCP